MNVQAKKRKKVTKTKIGIFGFKKFSDSSIVTKKLEKITQFKSSNVSEEIEVITYEDDGITALVRDYCKNNNISCKVINTKWELDKNAGLKRDNDIIKQSSIIVLFSSDPNDARSKRITDDVQVAKKELRTFCLKDLEKQTYYKPEEERPKTEKIVEQVIK